MEYQKTIKNNIKFATQQTKLTSKFKTRFWVEINCDASITYNTNNQIKTTILHSGLCHYSDTCILVKAITTVADTSPASAAVNNETKKSILIA